MENEEGLKTMFFFAGSTLVVMLFAIALLAVYFISRKKIVSKQLELNKLALRHQEELLEKYINGTEEERKRLAADLHDDVGTRLASFRLKLSENQSLLRAELDEIIQNVRDISHNIMPSSIELFGLDVSVEQLAEAFNESGAIRFSCNLQNADVLNSVTALSLYRVLQELINNTVRHSGASRAEIYSYFQNGMFILHYNDDGVGMPTIIEGGIGLRSIENRLRIIGARAGWVSGRENTGVSVTIQLPVSRP